MFGIINPPSSFNAPTSVSGMMPSVLANDTTGNLTSYASYTSNLTAGSPGENWGSDIDMSSMPDWSYDLVMANVMFTRNMLALNPSQVNADGSINLGAGGASSMNVPYDVGTIAAAASSPSAVGAAAAASSTGSASATSSSATTTPANSNGAMSVTSSKVLVGAMVLAATFFAL